MGVARDAGRRLHEADPDASANGSASALASAPPPDLPPRVKVVTIGMHVGGGPYDESTKDPIRGSGAELARCWKLVAAADADADAGSSAFVATAMSASIW